MPVKLFTLCVVLQVSWKVQGPDFAVPAGDPDGLVGRRMWLHFANTGWAPGTVAEYIPPTAEDEGTHVITFGEFEERMNIMQPTELVRLPLKEILSSAVLHIMHRFIDRSPTSAHRGKEIWNIEQGLDDNQN